jgi:hypothetical protein
MRPRARVPLALLLALVVALVPAGPARAATYDDIAAAYAQGGGQLNPCAFTQAQLEAGIRGIPNRLRAVVPDLRRAMEAGVAAHRRGDCRGVTPEEATTGGATAPGSTVPPVTTPPVTTPAPTATAPAVTTPPVATTPAPATTTEPAALEPAAGGGTDDRDLTPLFVALVVVGTLLLLALLLWGLARMRGWDPLWAARARHAWGEAGFRTTTTWSEFTDWLRLGR